MANSWALEPASPDRPEPDSWAASNEMTAPRAGETARPVDVPTSMRTDGRRGKRRRVSLRLGLILLILVSVGTTAGLIHLSWQTTARENVGDVVRQLNREIIVGIKYEIAGILANATAARDALHTIFSEDVIDTRDEAKREFVMLAVLRSQPNLSWSMIAWPDGTFFGAHRDNHDRVQMVEVRDAPSSNGRRIRRIDDYALVDGNIMFEHRTSAPIEFSAADQPWYRRAVRSEIPIWADASSMPTGFRPAIATAEALSVYREFQGVTAVAVDLARLSLYLDNITVGQSGSVYIIDTAGRVIAMPSTDAAAAGEVSGNDERMPTLDSLTQPAARIAAGALQLKDVVLREIVDPREIYYRDVANGSRYFVNVTPTDFSDWYVVTVAPEDDFLAAVKRNLGTLLIKIVGLTVIAGIFAAILSSIFVARPLRRVAGQLRHVQDFHLESIEPVVSPLAEVEELSGALSQMARGLTSFQKFIPTALVRTLVSQGVEARPGGAVQPITVMFTDLVGFTHLSETLGEGIVEVLGRYLGDMSRIVSRHDGTVDKFIGDAVMAFWGAPLPDPAHALGACRAALACQADLRARAHDYEELAGMPLQMRVGINTGDILVGNIGSDDRLNYTAVGDAVNVASRLEALNKRYGTGIIIGEATRSAAGGSIIARRIDRVAVYGRVEGGDLYELLSLSELSGTHMAGAESFAWVADYDAAYALYLGRRWTDAVRGFERVIALRNGDGPSSLMIRRCLAFDANPPPKDWNGIWVWDEK